MAGYRDRFLSYSARLAGKLPTRYLLRSMPFDVMLPFYHAVSDEPMPHIRQLYPIKTLKAFRQDLDFLLAHFEPLDYPAFAAHVEKGFPGSKPKMLLSFDDGLREVADLIAPVLSEKGVPAMVFCNSAFIDNSDLFYRYKVSLLLDAAAGSAEVERLLLTTMRQLSTAQSKVPQRSLRQQLLGLSYAQKPLLDSLAESIDLDFNAFLKSQRPYLDEQQIRTLIAAGHHIGGHSIDHPMYMHLPLEEQLRQTQTCIDEVQRRFRLNYRIFSFPFTDHGVGSRFFKQLDQQGIADYTFGCAGIKGDEASRHYQRVALEMADKTARQIIHGQLLFGMGASLLGKNTVRRHD